MTQIISNNNGGGGGGSYTPGTGIDISVDKEISIDTDVVQTVGNMVENLDDADNTHYPTAQAVKEAISASGGGDVTGPASSTDGNVVLFDGATGKLIKDSGANLSSKLDASAMSNNNYGGAWQGDNTHTPTKGVLYDKIHTMDVEIGNKAADNTVVKLTGNQTINGTKTFGTSPVVPSKSTDATNTGTAIATEAQVYNVQQDVDGINDLIPSAATSSNKLADKNYVDDSINSVAAYYITKNAQGDQWTNYAELAAATTFYSGGVVRVPTRNDYTIVLADENHDNATTRYSYQGSGWEYQYTVNETALTQAQLDALNSGITSGKVSDYDGYATSKQNTLVSGTNIKTINSQDVLGSGNITINEVPAGGTEGQVLTKTNDGIGWENPASGFAPENTGNAGDKLEKTASGYQWVEGELVEIIETPDDYSAIQGPAPSGFHIPLNTEWQAVYDAYTGLGLSGGANFSTYLKLPLAGYRSYNDATFYSVGSAGEYWSSSPFDTDYSYRLRIYSTSIFPQANDIRSNGRPVRCFKNSTVVPTASWTVIYQGAGDAGIFHNSTDGLISISSDGTNWITIADKNLGATTVWNNGDTLTEANIGKIYQRGNNYGFSGDPNYDTSLISKSSTQVDVTGYGPGNYYNSSTWITAFRRQSSANDGNNLRGGVTGMIPAYTTVEAGGIELAKKQIVLQVTLTSAGWSSSTQTVTATGVNTANTVIVSPSPSSFSDYTDAGIYCSAQSTNSLTFKCDSEPSNNITVNVMIFS